MMRALLFCLMLCAAPAFAAPEKWVVYYNDKLPAEAFMGYDLVVFDGQHHPPLAPLKEKGKIVLGYLSLGEAENYRPYFKELKKKKLLLAANPHWKGHYYIDIRKAAWREYVVETLIPALLEKGFDGVMFDTIDSPLYTETVDPKRYDGMREAAIQLIEIVRARFPNIKIMLNRGFEILPDVAPDIDMFMAESIYTDWRTGKKTASFVPETTHTYYMDTIRAAQAKAPLLKIYSIDYWPPKDTDGVKNIYAKQREYGFVPYVSVPNLQNIVAEPE